MIESVRRGLRALRYGMRLARGWVVILWYRSLYPNLKVGRNVRFGKAVHIHLHRTGAMQIGDGVEIDSYTHLVAQGTLVIGPRSYVGIGSMIVSAERVEIGADVLIAAYVTIRDQDHAVHVSDARNNLPLVTAPVTIGENAWLGTKATILRGTTIGRNAVVAAHAVVRSSVPTGSLVGGVPARVLRPKSTDEQSG